MARSSCILSVACIALAAAACASSPGRFALRPPLTRDTDLAPVNIPCRVEPTKKDPRHVSCTPEEYVSSLVWDGVDNSIFRPFSELFAFKAWPEAPNANSLDEVPDSSWFTNRIGVHPVDVAAFVRGACDEKAFLDGDAVADGEWVIDEGKLNGSTPGFRVNIKGKGKYLFKVDDASEQPERASAASIVGAIAYHAAGYYTSCEQIVYFKPSALKLTPGLKVIDNTGVPRKFDDEALKKVLKGSSWRGDRVRMQASAWLPGHLLGPFRYAGTRDDDPNDIISHEDRRELRGARLLAAWIDHKDSREQNSMDSWIAERKDAPESSPGFVRHYFLDMSDCLGSEWQWDGISRRLGRSYVLDWEDIGAQFISFGIPLRSWERVERTKGQELFGYYQAGDFVPENWKNEYPNPAFSRMSERDGAWMARILARFTPDMVKALATSAKFTDPSHTAFLETTLEARLQKILARYLTRLSPLADVHLVGPDKLCGTDLAELRLSVDPASFRHTVRVADGPALPVVKHGPGEMCVTLPHVAHDGGAADDAPERYVTVSFADGVSQGTLLAHLYDLGPSRGYRLAGLDRPEP